MLAEKKTKTTKTKKEESQDYVMDGPGTYLRESGVIMLTSSFTKSSIMPLCAQVFEYNIMPEEVKPTHITLIINSTGGELSSAFHLIDLIKSSEIPVHTIGFGTVASAGLMVLMAGKEGERTCTHNTIMMSHQYSGGISGKEHELVGSFKNFEMVSDMVLEHYVKCTGLKEQTILDHLLGPTDNYLTPDEAIKFNIVDQVWETY